MTLKIPISTVHNIIKRFRECGDICVQETANGCHSNHFNGSGTPKKNIVDQQIQVQALSCKEEAIWEHDPDTLLF